MLHTHRRHIDEETYTIFFHFVEMSVTQNFFNLHNIRVKCNISRKSITNVYDSTLLALRSGVDGCEISRKKRYDTLECPHTYACVVFQRTCRNGRRTSMNTSRSACTATCVAVCLRNTSCCLLSFSAAASYRRRERSTR